MTVVRVTTTRMNVRQLRCPHKLRKSACVCVCFKSSNVIEPASHLSLHFRLVPLPLIVMNDISLLLLVNVQNQEY